MIAAASLVALGGSGGGARRASQSPFARATRPTAIAPARRAAAGGAGRSGPGANSNCCRLSAGASSGVSLGLIERACVSTAPIATATGRRAIAGPSARKVPRGKSRIASAWRRSMPSRSAARAMSMSRKVRPIRKFDASAATFLASLASRWVAITPASPRLRPRHIKLVIAPKRGAAHLLGDLAAARRREQLRFVDHHQRRIPMLARRLEQPRQERRGALHLPLGLEPLEAQHDRGAMLADPPGELDDVALREIGRLDRDMAIAFGQRDEIALGIDHDLLDFGRAALEQAAQQMRFARPAIALHQQARRQQLFQIDSDGVAVGTDPHVHADGHCRPHGKARTHRQACASPGSRE